MDFSFIYQNNFKMFFPEVFLATSILLLTLHGTFIITSRGLGFPLITRSFLKLCILVLFLTFFLLDNNSIIFMLTYQNTFLFDFLTLNVKQILVIFTIFCLAVSEQSIVDNRLNNFEYLLLILCAILGLFFLASSYDLISLYLALEMQSLCLYVLAASRKNSSFSTEAGLKYFILGSFSSALFLFGVSLLYGCTGTTNFGNFSLLFTGANYELLTLNFLIEKSLLCIAVAFFFKVAAAPFHMWSPDVYEGSPTSSTIFFAVVPKIALFSVFLRLFQNIFFSFGDAFLLALLFCSIFSVIVGSFVALRQKKLKRILAYSSVSHVGYLLLAFSSNSLYGTQSLFFYLVIYMLTSICLWSFILSLNNTENVHKSKTLIDVSSVALLNPVLGFTGLLAFFSLAGVPPLAGFFAKMEIFICSIGSSLFFASIVAILSSVISSFFYIRLIKSIYFEQKEDNFFIFPVSRGCSLVMGVSLFLLLCFFFNPSLLLLLSQKMALCLF